MTEEERFEDLKQFVASVVNQSEVRLKNELASKDDLTKLEIRLETKIDDGFAGVGEAITNLSDQIDQDKGLTDKRITKLEKAVA